MGRNIAVNAIAPGSIDFDGVRAKLTPERLAQTLATQPTGKMGQTEEIANTVSFLASPEAGFLTGQVLLVDGGKPLGIGFGFCPSIQTKLSLTPRGRHASVRDARCKE